MTSFAIITVRPPRVLVGEAGVLGSTCTISQPRSEGVFGAPAKLQGARPAPLSKAEPAAGKEGQGHLGWWPPPWVTVLKTSFHCPQVPFGRYFCLSLLSSNLVSFCQPSNDFPRDGVLRCHRVRAGNHHFPWSLRALFWAFRIAICASLKWVASRSLASSLLEDGIHHLP